jgi:NitT/TauT family transport system ATP-binding protein
MKLPRQPVGGKSPGARAAKNEPGPTPERETPPGPAGVGGSASAALLFEGISKNFGGISVLSDVTLSVLPGEFVSIIGPSGCGKSTLLNLCSGLTTADVGTTHFQGTPVTQINTSVGYVPQDATLFPWLTVRENVGLSLSIKRVPKKERDKRVSTWISMVGLDGFENHYPRQLSGGMQKRCSIARTMIYEPDVVLLDEPFGPLDALTRLALQSELLNIWRQTGTTFVFVTHDLNEAISLSTKIVVMSRRPGRIRAVVPVDLQEPRDIYQITETQDFAKLHGELWEYVRAEL